MNSVGDSAGVLGPRAGVDCRRRGVPRDVRRREGVRPVDEPTGPGSEKRTRRLRRGVLTLSASGVGSARMVLVRRARRRAMGRSSSLAMAVVL